MIVKALKTASRVPVWFDDGEHLPVLAMVAASPDGAKFLLWSKKQASVGLFPVADFEIVDPILPAQWVAKTSLNGQIEFSPKEWQADGFWERYHDEEPNALGVFQKWFEALAGHMGVEPAKGT